MGGQEGGTDNKLEINSTLNKSAFNDSQQQF